jgi:hypothetical protein
MMEHWKDAGFRMQDARCKMQDARCKMQAKNSEVRIRNPGEKIKHPGCRMQGTEDRGQTTEDRKQFRIADCELTEGAGCKAQGEDTRCRIQDASERIRPFDPFDKLRASGMQDARCRQHVPPVSWILDHGSHHALSRAPLSVLATLVIRPDQLERF